MLKDAGQKFALALALLLGFGLGGVAFVALPWLWRLFRLALGA